MSTIKGIIFDYGGTIDTNGIHWGEVIAKQYRLAGIEIERELYRNAYVHGDRTLAKFPIIKPEDTFHTLLRKKIAIQFEYLREQTQSGEFTPEVAEQIAYQAYDKLIEVCDASVYFTQTASKKMYDVEVHAYNLEENRDSDEFVYVIVNKSSSMEAPIARLVSEPLDPELAAQLLEKLDRKLHPEKYETSDEITVGESDIEEGQTEGEE